MTDRRTADTVQPGPEAGPSLDQGLNDLPPPKPDSAPPDPEAKKPFTLVVLPDTQYYANGGCHDKAPCFDPAIFYKQTWYVKWLNDQPGTNLRFTAHLGDVVDDAGSDKEWKRGRKAFDTLDSYLVKGLARVIPYGIAPGDHDFISHNDKQVHAKYGAYFSVARYKQANPQWKGSLIGYIKGMRNSYP